MKLSRPVIAFAAFAVAASARDPSIEGPGIRLTTAPNPVADPVASANRLDPDGNPEALEGVFVVSYPGSDVTCTWDPVECRLMFARRGGELVYVAEGPAPAASTVGVFGPPNFFGYRFTKEGILEFLYLHGRLGIEEQVRPGRDGKSLVRRFRIDNADYGLVLTIPDRWKGRVKTSRGTWSGTSLKLSAAEAKEGVSLTYDFSTIPELPELPDSWSPEAEAGGEAVGPPGPEIDIEPAPGFIIDRIPLPHGETIRDFRSSETGPLVISTRAGNLYFADPGEDEDPDWTRFSRLPLPGVRILDASDAPNSVDVSHRHGRARLFDLHGDGAFDFFQALDDAAPTSPPNSTGRFPVANWDLVEFSTEPNPDGGPNRLNLRPLGLNPQAAASETGRESMIWIPASPLMPVYLGELDSGGRRSGAQLLLADSSRDGEWRFARILLERTGNVLQGAVIGFQGAQSSSRRIASLAAGGDGESIWIVPEGGNCLARLSRNGDSLPFEIRSVRLAPDAFEFGFSRPVDRQQAADPGNFEIRSEMPDRPGRELDHRVVAAIVDSDGMTLALRAGDIRPGQLIAFDFGDLRSETGELLAHGPVYYSVNALPDPPMPENLPIQPGNPTASPAEPGGSDSPPSTIESSRESKDASPPAESP